MRVQQGEVLSFDGHKGYGWIAVDDGEDVFVHANDLECDKAELRPGRLVDFVVVSGPKGERAAEVRPHGAEPASLAGSAESDTSRPDGAPERERPRTAAADDLEVDVLTPSELRVELTERLLAVDPPLVSTQVLAVRKAVDVIARRYGWIAD